MSVLLHHHHNYIQLLAMPRPRDLNATKKEWAMTKQIMFTIKANVRATLLWLSLHVMAIAYTTSYETFLCG